MQSTDSCYLRRIAVCQTVSKHRVVISLRPAAAVMVDCVSVCVCVYIYTEMSSNLAATEELVKRLQQENKRKSL